MSITPRLIAEKLRGYEKIRQRLAKEAVMIQTYIDQSSAESRSLYRSPGFDAPITHSRISDPTSYIAYRMMEAQDQCLPSRIKKFVQIHEEERHLMAALDACLKKLPSYERTLIRLMYFDRVSPMHVAMRAHLSLSAMYRERDRALEQLTMLIRTRLSDSIAQAS